MKSCGFRQDGAARPKALAPSVLSPLITDMYLHAPGRLQNRLHWTKIQNCPPLPTHTQTQQEGKRRKGENTCLLWWWQSRQEIKKTREFIAKLILYNKLLYPCIIIYVTNQSQHVRPMVLILFMLLGCWEINISTFFWPSASIPRKHCYCKVIVNTLFFVKVIFDSLGMLHACAITCFASDETSKWKRLKMDGQTANVSEW